MVTTVFEPSRTKMQQQPVDPFSRVTYSVGPNPANSLSSRWPALARGRVRYYTCHNFPVALPDGRYNRLR